MKLSKATKEQVLRGIKKEKFVPAIKKWYSDFQDEVTRIMKNNFKDFDFEKAKQFDSYIQYGESVDIEGFYSECRNLKDLTEQLGIGYGFRCLEIKFKYPIYYNRYDFGTTEEEKDFLRNKFQEAYVLFTDMIEQLLSVESVLYSCNTVKQLEELFPEIVKYIPVTQCTALIVSQETLNKAKEFLGEKNEEKKN